MLHIIFLFMFPMFLEVHGDNPIIQTIYGPVEGSSMKTIDQNKTYYAFQGIPFAAPPIGNLRFKSPIPPKKWTTTLKANNSTRMCTQITGNGTEDCLYLNVYTPNITGSNLSVMVYIYGGYYLIGDSAITSFGPDYLVNEDVILVTTNYRLGIFGFLSTEDLASPGNYGLKDQYFALQWVQSNIARFGGDPTKVLLFGQSAGSASVSYLLQSQRATNAKLFSKVILQSGNCLMPWTYAQSPRETAFALGEALGIKTTNSSELLQELREIDFDKLKTTALTVFVSRTLATNVFGGFIYAPYIEPEGVADAIVTDKLHESFSEGNFNKIPILVGFNSNEVSHFYNLLQSLQLYLTQYDIFQCRLTPPDMNASFSSQLIVGSEIHWKYFGLQLLSTSTNALMNFANDALFVRPAFEFTKLLSKYVSTYFYYFSYEGALGNPNRTFSGVGHGEELNYLFNIDTTIKDPSQSDLETRYRLVKMWTNFAKTGNPTPSKDGLLMDVNWKTTSPSLVAYLNIGSKLEVQTNLSIYPNLQFWNDLYNDYGNPPYNTY